MIQINMVLTNNIDYNVIRQIIEIGRNEALPEKFNFKNTWYLTVYYFNRQYGFNDLSDKTLEYFFKGIVLTEKASDRQMGSTTNTGCIYNRLNDRFENSNEKFKEIRDFAKLNRPDNPYAPTGGPLF